MNKKSLDQKTARKFIRDSRNEGKTNQEIYNELSQKYFDKKSIAFLVVGTVTTENKNKYKIHNNILLGLIGAAIVTRILFVFELTTQIGTLWTILLPVFVLLLFVAYFIYEIARFNAPFYRICGIMTIAGFLQSLSQSRSMLEIIVNLILAIAITVLTFYLGNKMFPNVSFKNLKKDDNGEYILGDT